VRIIIADHNHQARKALMAILGDQPGFTVIGEVDSLESLLRMSAKQPVDMILLDYELPGLVLRELIDQLRYLDIPPKVIVLSSNPERGRIALNVGADAFVSKCDQPGWLLATLNRFASLLNKGGDKQPVS
jgi:two-component system nitrate/nitrite response regulator NarL